MITLALNPNNTELALLIDQIEHGETITLTKNGQPVAQILPLNIPVATPALKSRVVGKWQIGLLKNKMTVADDFDLPLPDDILDTFEGKSS